MSRPGDAEWEANMEIPDCQKVGYWAIRLQGALAPVLEEAAGIADLLSREAAVCAMSRCSVPLGHTGRTIRAIRLLLQGLPDEAIHYPESIESAPMLPAQALQLCDGSFLPS